jgi:hypothetical protein
MQQIAENSEFKSREEVKLFLPEASSKRPPIILSDSALMACISLWTSAVTCDDLCSSSCNPVTTSRMKAFCCNKFVSKLQHQISQQFQESLKL